MKRRVSLIRATGTVFSLMVLVYSMAAETAEQPKVYVTDLLRLGLYADEMTTGQSQRTLLSGERLVVLERALRSVRVRADDGSEGWVKSAYLVTEPPAVLQVPILEQALASANDELANTLATTETANARIADLESNLADALQNIRNLPELKRITAQLQATLDAKSAAVSFNWLMGAAIGAFLLGCVCGYLFLARRVRKQFGGLRVY